MAKLTLKQENFCLAFLETGNATAAYRSSYNAARMKEATVNKRASELLASGDIAGRLAELRKPAIERAEMTLGNHLAKLAELRDQAKERGLLSAAIQAEIARGKCAGFYRHAEGQGTAIINQVNVNKRLEELSDEELMEIARGNGLRVVPSGQFAQEIKGLFQEL